MPTTVSLAHSSDGRDIVFAAACYRKSGRFYHSNSRYTSRGKPEDETLDFVSQSIYLVRPNGTGLRRLIVGHLLCESPKWSPDGKRIVFVASTVKGLRHIYLVNADGSGLRRLTSGNMTDSDPQWSPSGNGQMLFLRHQSSDRWNMGDPGTVCRIDVRRLGVASHPVQIMTSPAKMGGPHWAQWSPDGRYVAALFGIPWDDGDKQALRVAATTGRSVYSFPATRDFAWSPDSRRLVIVGTDRKPAIVNIKSGAKTPIAGKIRAPLWLTNDQWIGLAGDGILRRIAGDGKVLNDVTLGQEPSPVSEDKSVSSEIDDVDGDTWFMPGHESTQGLVCAESGMSDGKHFDCFRIDLQTGAFCLIQSGRCFALSPSGAAFLSSDDEWVGPYKRGGMRVGPLELVDLSTAMSGGYRRNSW